MTTERMTKQELLRLLNEKIEANRQKLCDQLVACASLPGPEIYVEEVDESLPGGVTRRVDAIRLLSEQWKVLQGLDEVVKLAIGAYPDPPKKPVDKAELLQ